MARFLGLRGTRLTSVISAVCGLCFLCYGYAQGVMGGLLTVPAFLEQFPEVDTISSYSFNTAWVTGLTVGVWNLGCIVSSIMTIFISDVLGRRRTLLIGITIWTIGEIIQASSYTFSQFIVGRAVAGFGNGFTTSTVPAYQAECVKSHRKGTILMVSTGAFVAFGYALSYWLVFGFAYADNTASWRAPVALQIVFALPAIVMLFFLPESPRWLILTGREQEALTVLAALNDADPEDYEIKDEFLQIKDAILVMAQGKTSKLFSNRERRGFHRVVLAYFVQVFQQGTGINLVLQYLSWIFFTRMSYSGWVSRLLASCSATTYFIASFVAVVGIDRFWGRRSLMMFGASGMSGCMVILTITQYLWSNHSNHAARIVSTVFLFGFSIFFAIGWQGMAWLYQVEIVPLRIRGPANALSTKVNWIVNFAIVFITPIAFQNIGYRTWIIFAATNLAIVPLVYFFYPETAFRSLEEVDVIFFLADEAPGNPWLNAVRISLHEPLWFGKRGEVGFDYANSSWHRKLMDTTSSGSGSGTGSSNEKRGRKGKNSNTDSSEKSRGLHSSGSDTVVQPPLPEKRSGSESPIDPMMYAGQRASSDHSPTNTLTTTITAHPNTSKRSLRQKLSRRFSSSDKGTVVAEPGTLPDDHVGMTPLYNSSPDNQRLSPDGTSPSPDGVGRFSPEADPTWWTSDMAPAPLRVSRPPSEEHRPYSSDGGTYRSFHHPDHTGTSAQGHGRTGSGDSDKGSTKSHVSFSYPGRLRTGLVRTESGRETYAPDGVGSDEEREGKGDSGGSRKARDAGRAF